MENKKPTALKQDIIAMNIRLPRKTWMYIKTFCMKRNIKMNSVIIHLIENHRAENSKKVLTAKPCVGTIAPLTTEIKGSEND